MSSGRSTQRPDLHRMLEPSSVAIVGASVDEAKRGYQTIRALQEWGYDGEVYPVNPNYADRSIRGLDVYASVTDVPGTVDLAFVATPARIVPNVIEDCGNAGVAGAIVVAAGFSEIGNDDLEDRVLRTARDNDVRLIGPNCNGYINVHHDLDLLYRTEIPRGGLAMLSQSGNIASALVYEAIASGLEGFSFYISVGNEVDVAFDEYLPFLRAHDETDAAMLYVEGMSDGRAFLREAAKTVRDTPIVALKGGLSDVGKQSAASHTASIAGNGAVVDDVYRQAGVVRVDRSDELLAVSDALANQPPADGPNVGILSDGGGHATHAADSLTDHGLSMPDLAPETQERIRERVPENAPNVVNPVDVLTLEYDLDIFYDCAAAMLEDPNVDALLLLGYFGGYGTNYGDESTDSEVDVAKRLAGLVDRYDKPIVAQTMFATQDSPGVEALQSTSIPVFESVNTATRCVAALETYGRHLRTADRKSDFAAGEADPAPVVRDAVEAGRTSLSEYEAKQLLASVDAPVTPFERATTADEAVAAAASFDGPVAMKVVSPDIVHKSEAGGVALDVTTAEAADTYDDLLAAATEYAPDAQIDGVLVSPMADESVELIVGVVDDEQFGPVVMCGLGGVFVEVLEDVAFRALPLTEADARALLDDIDAQEMLDGARGNPAVDRDAVVDLLVAVSDFVEANPSVSDLDLNPVFATEDGVEIVDAAITLTADGPMRTDSELAEQRGITDD